ncbi:MAG TPA: type II/IV secretion system protein [Aquifex sp.]|nr:type II/IV secretion system protein [Aquifex sp.]
MNDRILDFLSKLGVLSPKTVEEIRKRLKDIPKGRLSVLEFIVQNGYIDEERLLEILHRNLGLKVVKDLSVKDLDLELIKRVPLDLIMNYKVIPYRLERGTLEVLTTDPFNTQALQSIKFVMKAASVRPVLVPISLMENLLLQITEQEQSILSELIEQIDEDDVATHTIEDVGEGINWSEIVSPVATEAPLIKLVNAILLEGVKRGASDIHIEPQEKQVVIRFRIDGILRIFQRFPARIKDAIIARIKVMAKLDISERRRPQDGRMRVIIQGRKIDFRVSTLPTIYGEKVVLRIQEAEKYLNFKLEDLGFEADYLHLFRHYIWQPGGMVLVVGPTGSGKTTTLYTAIQERNTPEVNIMTAEDPVEVAIPGINQVQINEKIGLTFATVLRAFLRQDPDIILVGEIRDLETAEIAVKAALTGHLVLSTLHTNDAPSAVTRLVDMGVEPFLVETATNLIGAQRLVRKLCPKCRLKAKEVYPEDYYKDLERQVKHAVRRVIENLQLRLQKEKNEKKREKLIEDIKKYQELYNRGIEIYTENPEGCAYCNNLGYKGRIAIHEMLELTPTIKKMILKEKPTEEIKMEAVREGMRTLYEDGLVKIGKGLTSIEEIKRVLVAEY